jgi:putative DNA primase/helicase
VVCADNDASGAGERAAKATGLPYTMPPDTGTDFNDMHQACGIYAVIAALRGAL